MYSAAVYGDSCTPSRSVVVGRSLLLLDPCTACSTRLSATDFTAFRCICDLREVTSVYLGALDVAHADVQAATLV